MTARAAAVLTLLALAVLGACAFLALGLVSTPGLGWRVARAATDAARPVTRPLARLWR